MSMPATSSMPVVGVVVVMSMLAQGSRFPRVCVRCAMPLSQAQVDILKTPTTVIEIQRQNPKKPGSKSFERFMLQPKAPTGRICRQTLKKVTWKFLISWMSRLKDLEVQKGLLLRVHQTEKQKQGAKWPPQNSCPESWFKKIKIPYPRWKWVQPQFLHCGPWCGMRSRTGWWRWNNVFQTSYILQFMASRKNLRQRRWHVSNLKTEFPIWSIIGLQHWTLAKCLRMMMWRRSTSQSLSLVASSKRPWRKQRQWCSKWWSGYQGIKTWKWLTVPHPLH